MGISRVVIRAEFPIKPTTHPYVTETVSEPEVPFGHTRFMRSSNRQEVSVTPNSAPQLTPEQQAVQQIPWQPTFKEEKVESTTKSQDLGDLTHT